MAFYPSQALAIIVANVRRRRHQVWRGGMSQSCADGDTGSACGAVSSGQSEQNDGTVRERFWGGRANFGCPVELGMKERVVARIP